MTGARVVARCVHGLEWVLAAEIASTVPHVGDLELGRREVAFTPSVSSAVLDAGVLALRTADDAFLTVGELLAPSVTTGLGAFADRTAGFDWPAALDAIEAVRPALAVHSFDVVASVEGRRPYSRFDVEAAVGEALARRLGARFLERTPGGLPGESDLTVRVFVRDPAVLVAVRIGVRPLHRRDYKLDSDRGTLHPPVAAAMATLAAPAVGTVLDPFCGDGTIAIETALARPGLAVRGSDLDPARLANAARNAERAGVSVRFCAADAGNLGQWDAGSVDVVLTNPPWSRAVDWGGALAASPRRFWNGLPRLLGDGGALCCLTDVDLGLPELLAAAGWAVAAAPQLRVAGRVVHLTLAAPPGAPAPRLPAEPARWRARAVDAGVVTELGF